MAARHSAATTCSLMGRDSLLEKICTKEGKHEGGDPSPMAKAIAACLCAMSPSAAEEISTDVVYCCNARPVPRGSVSNGDSNDDA
mmetsp:Transcript_28893/g.68843  ORF Transcript_28893/g.68843 Transcript_28893/m.68843 type:complete len:85 (-) Transcript_28893:1910-2164(-)